MFPYAGITQFKLKGMFSAPNPGAPLTNELNRLFYRLLAEHPVRVNTNFHVALIPIFKRRGDSSFISHAWPCPFGSARGRPWSKKQEPWPCTLPTSVILGLKKPRSPLRDPAMLFLIFYAKSQNDLSFW